MQSSSVSGDDSFNTSPTAPSFIASTTSSSATAAVSSTVRHVCCSFASARSTSSPFQGAIRKSSTRTSG